MRDRLARRPLPFLFGCLLGGGWVAVIWLKPPLYQNHLALGLHAIALLVPFVAAVAYVAAGSFAGRVDRRHGLAALALFGLLALPFADLWGSPIAHLEGDDSYRYSRYARHMLESRTLWGSDGLLTGRPYYVDQPGYRYYLALTIAALGGEHRGLQLFDMGVLLIATIVLLGTLAPRIDPRRLRVLAVFFVLAAPYAAKNVLYGYAEWLAVALALLCAAAFAARRDVTAICLLALLPFVRQNLMPVSLLLAALAVFRTGRPLLTLPYLALLGLPLYHNLYYAAEWRLLVENTGALLRPQGSLVANLVETARIALSKVPHYAGYHPDQKPLTLAIAVLFAPLGSLLVLHPLAVEGGRRRWVLAAVAVATVAPTLIFGSGSYPRFVYVNLSVILLAYAAIEARSGQGRSADDPC